MMFIRFLLFILFFYLVYKVIKYMVKLISRPMSKKQNNDLRSDDRSEYKIKKEDIIEAEFEEIKSPKSDD